MARHTASPSLIAAVVLVLLACPSVRGGYDVCLTYCFCQSIGNYGTVVQCNFPVPFTSDTLDWSNKGIFSIAPGVFAGLSNLKVLNLGGNALTGASIDAHLFDPLVSLDMLYLNGNLYLGSLPVGIFDNLPMLRVLYLSTTGLATLNANMFDKLTKLSYLDLSNNLALGLTACLDSCMCHAATGVVASCAFPNPTAVTTLNWESKGISFIAPNAISALTNLQSMMLRGNNIKLLSPYIIQPFPKLSILDVYGLPLNSFACGQYCQCSSAGVLYSCTYDASITSIALDGMGITAVSPSAYAIRQGTKTISLANNSMSWGTATVFLNSQSAWGLASVNLNFNGLGDMPAGALDNAANTITSLSLKGNNIALIPPNAFDKLSLSSLDLSGNVLSSVPVTLFSQQKNLDTLSLASNKLSALPATVFANQGKLSRLDLSGNSPMY
eukprot:Opistho-1_new@19757